MSKITTQIKKIHDAAGAMRNCGMKEVARNNLFTMDKSSVAYLTKELSELGVRMRRAGEKYDNFEYGSSNRPIVINIEDLFIADGMLLNSKLKKAA